ncbi:hypothetical protein VaNZ11_000359 [Volvox africanus]|uniref:Uncharacterized protein n=1 Tax=Volvox africanus TaxID=51714 RepID=A0ABQ5RMS3_9CHLO|nr:hypothetical protein VaNZ11_000359 [Volvox africanus]
MPSASPFTITPPKACAPRKDGRLQASSGSIQGRRRQLSGQRQLGGLDHRDGVNGHPLRCKHATGVRGLSRPVQAPSILPNDAQLVYPPLHDVAALDRPFGRLLRDSSHLRLVYKAICAFNPNSCDLSNAHGSFDAVCLSL